MLMEQSPRGTAVHKFVGRHPACDFIIKSARNENNQININIGLGECKWLNACIGAMLENNLLADAFVSA